MPPIMRLTLAAIFAFAGLRAMARTTPMVVDADGDGFFSLQEIRAAYPGVTTATFVAIDTNHNGKINADELAAAVDDGTLKSGM